MISTHTDTSSHTPAPPSNAGGPHPRRRRLRHTAVVAAAVFIIVVAGLWFDQTPASAGAESAAPPPPEVTVAPVTQRLIVDHAERIGRVVATETVELRPEVSGRITHVGFAAGEPVRAGQVLFTIDPQSYAAAVDVARAEVARAEARAASALREADRASALREQQAISNEESELRRSRAAETQAELLAARAALASAEIDLARTEVRSPIDGRVSRAYVTEGNVVSGGAAGATLLTTIVSTGEVHVYVNVDEATIHRFRRALAEGILLTDADGRIPVELRLDQSETYTHHGYVESLDNRIDPQTGSLTVRLHFDDPQDQLLPGSFARVRVPVSAAEPRLLISERAIGTDQSQKFVLVVGEDETVAYRPVTLGPLLGAERIIVSGLSAGERVVVNGLQWVRPGMAVSAREQTTSPASSTTGLAAR